MGVTVSGYELLSLKHGTTKTLSVQGYIDTLNSSLNLWPSGNLQAIPMSLLDVSFVLAITYVISNTIRML